MPADRDSDAHETEIGDPPSLFDLSGEIPTVMHPTAETAPYDATRDREQARGQIAFYLLNLLAFIIIGSFCLVGLAFMVHWGKTGGPVDIAQLTASIKQLLELMLTPIIGLVGAATGFYFGEKSAKG